MAYDSALVLNQSAAPVRTAAVSATIPRTDDFHRFERLVVLTGASALGAVGGFIAAMTLGRLDLWMIILGAAPFLVLALHLTSEMMREGLRGQALGCATAAGLHVTALLAWPMTSLFAPLSTMNFWIAPAIAMSALFMLASCWQGASRGVFRVSAIGLIVAAVAVNQGTMLFIGA